MKRYLMLLIISILLISCGSNKNEFDDPNLDSKEFIYSVMYYYYYWDETIDGELNLNGYKNADELLSDLRYRENGVLIDRWSYYDTITNNDMYFDEGEYLGYGFSMRIDLNNSVIYVSYVYPGSPADNIGLKRGSVIHSIDGKTIAQIEENKEWDTIFGADEIGATIKVEASRTIYGETQIVADLVKKVVKFNSVYMSKIIEIDDKRIGYLVFDSFISPAKTELKNEFKKFKESGVTDFILDLRYNGGGYVSVSNELSAYINSSKTKNQIFQILEFDSKKVKGDQVYIFDTKEDSLNLDRVFILTGTGTASASEAVINGLKPFIEVIQIGETTHGKPVGMNGYQNSNLGIVFWPVTFKVKNGLREGDYFFGIEPDKTVSDNINYLLGNEEEPMLKEALYYIKNGEFTPEKKSSTKQYKIVERKGIIGNMNKF